MPVGTYGTVKGVMPQSLHDMGAQIILGNTFHLWMRPGQDVMQSFGGLHGFESGTNPSSPTRAAFRCGAWAPCARSPKKACTLPSPVNGDKLFMSPEVSMQIQTTLNSDIVMQLDECTPYETKGHLTTEPRPARAWR
jgi:queuine tRNA-ribosyltransferase